MKRAVPARQGLDRLGAAEAIDKGGERLRFGRIRRGKQLHSTLKIAVRLIKGYAETPSQFVAPDRPRNSTKNYVSVMMNLNLAHIRGQARP